MRAVKKDLSFYEGMVQRAKDGLKAAGSDKAALNAKRNYSDYAEPFKDMYKYMNEDRYALRSAILLGTKPRRVS